MKGVTSGAAMARHLWRTGVVRALPVSMSELLKFYGIKIFMAKSDTLDALLSVSGGAAASSSGAASSGSAVLTLNAAMPRRRMRFAAAHELGHFLLKHNPLSDNLYRAPPQERQADLFASELLMPSWALCEPECAQNCAAQLLTLSRRFDVSRQAVKIRLQRLGLLLN